MGHSEYFLLYVWKNHHQFKFNKLILIEITCYNIQLNNQLVLSLISIDCASQIEQLFWRIYTCQIRYICTKIQCSRNILKIQRPSWLKVRESETLSSSAQLNWDDLCNTASEENYVLTGLVNRWIYPQWEHTGSCVLSSFREHEGGKGVILTWEEQINTWAAGILAAPRGSTLWGGGKASVGA